MKILWTIPATFALLFAQLWVANWFNIRRRRRRK
jgi:hypothetical protein